MAHAVFHLIILNETPTYPPFSGAENHLFVLLPALQAAGLRVELGVMLINNGPLIKSKIVELQAQGIAVHCFPYRRHPYDLGCLVALRHHLLARREYIVHTHLDLPDVYGKIAARLAGCQRVVSTVHNNEPHHLRPKWFYLLRLLDHLTTRHIAISNVVRRHLVEVERVSPGKVTVIPYGVPLPKFTPDRAELRARLGLPDDKFVVGFVGRLVEQKNIPLLIAALARLPEMLCAIVGEGPLRRSLEQQAAGMNHVRFLGYQSQAETLMSAFDVLCLPSRWEGLGLVLIEAMLRRVPVIGSRTGAIPEILGEGQYGLLFDPDDVDDLIGAIKSIPTFGTELAHRAYAYARETYTVHKMVERTLAVYANL